MSEPKVVTHSKPCEFCGATEWLCANCLEFEPEPIAAAAVAPELAEAKREKDGAYHERNQLVAALSRLFPAGVARTAIEGWSEDWHGCVYIDLPTGQVSWHFHDSEAPLFAHLAPYGKPWDGHDTPEKYRRLDALRGVPAGNHESVP